MQAFYVKVGSNKLRLQAFYVRDDAPLALRVMQGHSFIEATPALMERGKITESEAPRVCHGTRFCNVNSILKHGILPGKATESGRSDMFFSAVLTPGSKRRTPTMDGGFGRTTMTAARTSEHPSRYIVLTARLP